MWTNKHVIIALLVAPILSILAWYAVGHWVGETPHAAEEGRIYKLVARSNCRYTSGSCDLHNAEFEITLTPTRISADGLALELVSKHPLEGATIGLVEPEMPQDKVSKMAAAGSDATRWTARIRWPADPGASLRVAALAGGATYYAEVPVVFMQPGS